MSHNKPSPNRLQQGFTFIEILIIAPIVILTIGAFITVIVGMTGEVLASRASNVLAYNVQDALNRIEDDVRLSSTFLPTNNITLTSGQGYDDTTAGFSNASVANGEMLILSVPVTTGNPMSIANSIVYLANKPRPCGDPQITGNTPLTMNVIYFVKGNTLYRRTIMPSNYNDMPNTVCNAPWQQPSCAPNITGTLCKTQDIKLVDGIGTNGFNVDYFNLANDTAANTVASDPTQLDPARGTAMQATATVGVTINSASTVAGRDISQSATLRATRLDINASTIAAVVPDTVPVAPTVTATFVGPDNAQFTWPAVPGASTYQVYYTLDATGANTYALGFDGSIATTFSITGIRNQMVSVHVRAINSAGASPIGSAYVTIPPWNALTLQNSWNDYGNTFATSAYTKSSDGVVMLKGLIRGGSTTAPGIIAQLPAGYWPSERLIFQTSSVDTASRVDVDTNGNIYVVTGSTGWVSLDGINFIPSNSTYTWNAMAPFLNNWVVYSSPPWALPAYTKDLTGRVHLKGLISGGTATEGAPIKTLPAGYNPPEYMHISTGTGASFGFLSIDASSNILFRAPSSNSFLSLQEMYYPAVARSTGSNCVINWCNLTMQNSWVTYGNTYSLPQYTKSADGIVTIKGLIRGGAASTTIANLPVGYRPNGIILLNGVCVSAYCRIDVYPNGDIIGRAGVSGTWTSMDAMTFMAEQ